MNDMNSKPIVGMVDYGLVATLMEIGGKPLLCSPYIPIEKLTPENNVFLCMQNEKLSPFEIFRILMWVLEKAVIGGYETNVEDTINFLKSNGITMRSGKFELTFDIKKDEHLGYTMSSYDDRCVNMGHYESLDNMASALYNALDMMSREFKELFDVTFIFRGDKSNMFASLLDFRHSPEKFNLFILND